jgi:hypothetical protein
MVGLYRGSCFLLQLELSWKRIIVELGFGVWGLGSTSSAFYWGACVFFLLSLNVE